MSDFHRAQPIRDLGAKAPRAGRIAAGLISLAGAGAVMAVPTVVPGAEGQIGPTPALDVKLATCSLVTLGGQAVGVLANGMFVPPAQPPELNFYTDRLHAAPNPVSISSTPLLISLVAKAKPGSARTRNAADDGDFVAFSFAEDGTMPNTMTIRIATFDETGQSLQTIELENIGTVPFPDNIIQKTAVEIDNQGRIIVAYTEFQNPDPPGVLGQRYDADGNPIGGSICAHRTGAVRGRYRPA